MVHFFVSPTLLSFFFLQIEKWYITDGKMHQWEVWRMRAHPGGDCKRLELTFACPNRHHYPLTPRGQAPTPWRHVTFYRKKGGAAWAEIILSTRVSSSPPQKRNCTSVRRSIHFNVKKYTVPEIWKRTFTNSQSSPLCLWQVTYYLGLSFTGRNQQQQQPQLRLNLCSQALVRFQALKPK